MTPFNKILLKAKEIILAFVAAFLLNETVKGSTDSTNTDGGTSSGFWNEIRYFKPSEFDSRDAPGSGIVHMKERFVRMLDKARDYAKMLFYINSGYRTPSHNQNVGGSPSSSHLLGIAGDIACTSKEDMRLKLIALYWAGFRRLGQYYTKNGNWFIHADTDESKNQVFWGWYKDRYIEPYYSIQDIAFWAGQ